MSGQAMGDGNPDRAAYGTHSVLHLALAYMGVMALVFWFMPEFLVNLFRARGSAAADFNAVLLMGEVLMRYCAVFTILDAVAIVYIGGLKGAGDTRFIMTVMGSASILCVVLPLLTFNALGMTSIHGPWIFPAHLCADFGLGLHLPFQQGTLAAHRSHRPSKARKRLNGAVVYARLEV